MSVEHWDNRPRSGDLEVKPCGPGSSGEAARVRLGASTATEPAVLRNLAGDSSVNVRAVLALNPATPSQVNETLAGDPDERVRILLARKLAVLAPSLSASDQAQLRRETWETLTGTGR